ncbi:hypothetical protein ASC90_24080 [Rhizobium sp. Root1220]|nr:hypothetical protein ASC90_24080 [Rhizobium sp. Root1220]
MRYAVIQGSDLCIVSRIRAEAEREREFFTSGRSAAQVVEIGESPEDLCSLLRELARQGLLGATRRNLENELSKDLAGKPL